MKIKNRVAMIAALATAGAVALTGCTGTGGGTTPDATGPVDTSGTLSGTVKFQTWSLKNEKFTPYFEDVIAKFEDENPEVTVEWLDQPGDGYQDKILSQANSGTLPDVLNLPPDIAYPLVSAGKLLDLNTADATLKDKYNAGAWQAYNYPGVEGTFGLPWYLSSDVAWWNLGQLKDYGVTEANLPTSNEELITLAERIADESDGKVALLSSMPTLDTFMASGIPLLNDAGEFVFNTAEAAAIVDDVADAYSKGALPAEALTGDYAGNAAMFIQEKVAYTTGGTGFTTDLQKDAPNLLKNVVATPRVGISPLYVQGVNVSAESSNKEAALAFAEFVTNTQNQVEFSKLAVGTSPGTIDGGEEVATAVKSAAADEQTAAAIETVIGAMKDAQALPFQWTGAMTTYMNQQMALALKGDLSGQEVLDKIVQYANDNRVDQ